MVVQKAFEFPRNAHEFLPIFWEETGDEPTVLRLFHATHAFLFFVDGTWTSLYSSFICRRALAQLVVKRTQPPAIINVVELQEERKSLKWVLLSPSVAPHSNGKAKWTATTTLPARPLGLSVWKSVLHKTNGGMIICLLITNPSFYTDLGSKTSLSSPHY